MLAICYNLSFIMQAFVDRLHADKQHAVIIIEGGVKIDAAYQAFVEGLKRKAYIQDLTGNPYVGQVSSTQINCQNTWTGRQV